LADDDDNGRGLIMVTVRYFAAARAAAGQAEQVCHAPTLAGLIDEMAAQHSERLAKVLAVSSFLVDGVNWRDLHALLPAGCVVDVLPPFAGG
jgi:molybdopterin converting factor small subunit